MISKVSQPARSQSTNHFGVDIGLEKAGEERKFKKIVYRENKRDYYKM